MKPFEALNQRKDSYQVRDNEVFIYYRTNTTAKTISLSFEAIEELYKAIKENENK